MVARTYARDAFHSLVRLLRGDQLTLLPIGVLLLPGLVLLFRTMDRRLAFVLAAATLLQAALVNLKAYEGRYFIFAVPLIGAAAAAVARAAWERLEATGARVAAAALPAGVAGIALLGAHPGSARGAARPGRRIVRGHAGGPADGGPGRGARRTEVLCWRSIRGVKPARLPRAGTLDELRAGWRAIPERPLYLFFGSAEARLRPALPRPAATGLRAPLALSGGGKPPVRAPGPSIATCPCRRRTRRRDG